MPRIDDFQLWTETRSRPRLSSRLPLVGRPGKAREEAPKGRALSAAPEDSERLHVAPGSRKSVLIEVVMELWKLDLFRSKELFEARGREVEDEAKMSRVCIRSTSEALYLALEANLKSLARGGRKFSVVVSGRLTGTTRTTLERLGLEVYEEHDPDERRYMDMTPFVLAMAGVMMAMRYLSLGLNDQVLYIFAGLGMALLYCLRPFMYDMRRPRE